jgi:glucokinase
MGEAAYWMAVDLGGSSLKMALWDGRRLSHQERIDFRKTTIDAEWIGQRLKNKLKELGDPAIRSVAVGVPSVVNAKRGIVIESANLGWKSYPLARLLKEILRVPVHLETDILCAARQEAVLGVGRNCKDFIYINLGTGVSHVRMLNGEPQVGTHGLGLNLGHAPLFSGGPGLRRLCVCGRPYCVETVIGGRWVATKLRRLSGRSLHKFWKEYGENLGIVLSSVTSLVDVERIVLNGGICKSRALFEASMRKAFEGHTAHLGTLPRVSFSRLGDSAGLAGAGITAQRYQPS